MRRKDQLGGYIASPKHGVGKNKQRSRTEAGQANCVLLHENIHEGVVIATAATCCRIRVADDVYQCQLRNQTAGIPVVGDRVRIAITPDQTRLIDLLPRTSCLVRPDPKNQQQELVIAANIDYVVVVVAAKTPPLHPKLIDRYLLAIERGGAKALIALNKCDLLSPDEVHQAAGKLHPYHNLGIPIIQVSAVTGEGIAAMHNVLHGATSVLVGHSGVGKSSLLRALAPDNDIRITDVRKADGKGRHTTTAATMYDLPGGGALIDTPGVRGFGLWKMTPQEIRASFHEFDRYAASCRFANCMHLHEPDCAVTDAVCHGLIPQGRYDSYRRLLGESTDDTLLTQHVVESSFICVNCGFNVPLQAQGTSQRNHCPQCLWSAHDDNQPGDRASCCHGAMEPVAVWVRKGGEWAIVHRCRKCGTFHSNRIAGDDNEVALMSLAVRPLAQPPFQLERMYRICEQPD